MSRDTFLSGVKLFPVRLGKIRARHPGINFLVYTKSFLFLPLRLFVSTFRLPIYRSVWTGKASTVAFARMSDSAA